MKKTLFILLVCLSTKISGQTLISGTIKDAKGQILSGVNVYIKNSFDGNSTDANGKFSFTTTLTGDQILVCSFIGYNTIEKSADLKGENIIVDAVLKDDSRQLTEVTITAGSFEAGNEKKAVVLNALDIVTTAGASADIYGALRTLPGSQPIGEDGRLFVRGGDAYECNTFIDGMMVKNPYYSNTPDIPVRGRFSPFLFSGTTFSTGGYSAEFGQAMSSALLLRTQALPEDDNIAVSLMSLGIGVTGTKKYDKSSLALGVDYSNLNPYFKIFEQNLQCNDARSVGGMLVARQKIGEKGMLRIMGTFYHDNNDMDYPIPWKNSGKQNILLTNDNAYVNLTYNNQINEKWSMMTGLAGSHNIDDMRLPQQKIYETDKNIQARVTITRVFSNVFKIKSGIDNMTYNNNLEYTDTTVRTYIKGFSENLTAWFAESEFKPFNKIAVSAGVRAEYSNLLNRKNISPRISMAYAFNNKSQISMAAGRFYQDPPDEFLRFTSNLNYEHADHYIINYQYMDELRTFRIEPYYKVYQNLTKTRFMNSHDESDYNNSGKGYARGIDVFWRDQKTIPRGDYWISYSFTDARRNYRDYPSAAVPTFVASHNVSVVYKYFVAKLSTMAGITYSFSSGRTYYNPNNPDFLSDKTRSYHDMGLNFSYLTSILGCFTVVNASVSNVLGANHVFSYRYSDKPGLNGEYERYAVKPMGKRFYFIGVFITIK